MNWFFEIPLPLRAVLVFVVGACVGGQVNRGIYRLAWFQRRIGPWSLPEDNAPPRRWFDRVPILGWLGLRRESALHGKCYWLRPLLIELATGLGLAVLYYGEMNCWLLPVVTAPPSLLHVQFLSHAILISLMMVATFIDFDEKMIPDSITLPGTLAGLGLMAMLPAALPPTLNRVTGLIDQVVITSPKLWSDWMHGSQGLYCGLACFAGWVLAILPKTITMRRGLFKCLQYMVVSVFRYSTWWLYVVLWLVGTVLIIYVWTADGLHWMALFSSLVGMAFAGGLVWMVRIIGSHALDKEAMGFGDVTLMAMIGSYWGWQASLIIFFLAPFAAVFISLSQWLLTRRKDIAFGPYLCLGTLIVMLGWPTIWEEKARDVFNLGWLIPQILAVCLGLMYTLLMFWRFVQGLVYRD